MSNGDCVLGGSVSRRTVGRRSVGRGSSARGRVARGSVAHRTVVRGTLSVLSAAVLTLVSAPAWAHVEVEADRASAGAADVDLTFHVPNEQAPATTRSITILFPADHPLLGVTTTKQNGFTPTVSTARLPTAVKGPKGWVSEVVRSVEFSGGALTGEDEKSFTFHVDQLPSDTRTLTFKALQTYSTGATVSWIEVAADGTAEPEHPAPVLVLGAPAAPAAAPPAPDASPSPSPAAEVRATPVTGSVAAPVTGSAAATPVVVAATGFGTPALMGGATAGSLVLVVLGWVLWRRRRQVGDAS